jgi:phage FluMu gp28-like protein
MTNDIFSNFFYPYQKKIITDPSKFICVVMSRQVGKSFAVAARAIYQAYFDNQNVIVISTSLPNSKRLIRTCKKIIKLFELALKEKMQTDYDNAQEIQFRDKGKITAIASNPDTAVGETGHIIIDEASRFKNSEEILDAVMPFITRGFTMTMVSTPLGKRGMFWDAYEKANRDDSQWSLHECNVYDAIEQGCPIDIDSIKEEMDEVSFRQNYMCEFIDDLMSFFSYELILSSTNRALRNLTLEELCKLNRHCILYAGYDPGKWVDSGVFTVTCKYPDGRIEVVHQKSWLGTPYTEQEAYIIQFMQTAPIRKLQFDATGVGDRIQEALVGSLGTMVEPVKYTNSIKESLVTGCKMLMEKGILKIPDNPKLIDQFHSIEREITASGNTRYSHTPGKHDDMVLSLCHALDLYGMGPKANVDGFIPGKKMTFFKDMEL